MQVFVLPYIYYLFVEAGEIFSIFASCLVISTTSVVLERHPVAANAIIYGGLYTAAEISQQKLREDKHNILEKIGQPG